MEKFIFYYQELIGGNKYKDVINAENFRVARNKFFDLHQSIPHRIDAVWNETLGKKVY